MCFTWGICYFFFFFSAASSRLQGFWRNCLELLRADQCWDEPKCGKITVLHSNGTWNHELIKATNLAKTIRLTVNEWEWNLGRRKRVSHPAFWGWICCDEDGEAEKFSVPLPHNITLTSHHMLLPCMHRAAAPHSPVCWFGCFVLFLFCFTPETTNANSSCFNMVSPRPASGRCALQWMHELQQTQQCRDGLLQPQVQGRRAPHTHF